MEICVPALALAGDPVRPSIPKEKINNIKCTISVNSLRTYLDLR